MTFSSRVYSIGLMCLVLFSAAFAQTQISRNLVLNQPFESEIKGGETQFYVLNIDANQTARVEIIQKGVEVSLVAFKPNGEKFLEAQTPSGVLGNDLLLITATEAGEYKVSVEPAAPKADPGRYEINLTEIRPTSAEDNEINRRAAQIYALNNEITVLQQQNTREARREIIEKYQQIIALARLQRDKVWQITASVMMGLTFDQLGEIQTAIDLHETGLRISREIGNREHEGSALNNLGNSYKNLGDYEKATFYLVQSLDIQRETNDKYGEAIILNNLGGTYLLRGDLQKARELYQQSIILRRLVKDRRGEGNVLNNLGQVFARGGDQAKAIEYLQQALAIRRTLGDKPGEAVTLRNLGKSFWDAGDKAKAREYFSQSNALANQLGDRRVLSESFYWLAITEKDAGDLPKAIENVENGLALTEQIRGELISPELRVLYGSTVQQFYDLYTELLVARYDKSKKETDVALALEISERARTRSLVELLQEARVDFKQGVNTELVEQAHDLQAKLNRAYRQRTVVLAGKPAPEQIAKITNEINVLTAEIENLQVKIRRENPRYASLTSNISISAREIQNLLDEETVLLEYKLGDARSFLWMVTKDEIEIFRLPPRKEIEQTAKDFYAAVAVPRVKSKDAPIAEPQKRLSEILLGSIAGKIGGKRLAIIADGVLQFIPFAALEVQEPAGKSRFLSNEVVVLPSATVLAELRRNFPTRKTPEKTIAVFADPIFEKNDPRLLKNAEKSVQKSVELSRVLRDFNIGENLPRLLSSRAEARNISAFAPKNQAISNVDFEASRENAMSENLANYRILHFATHGLLDSAHPEFSGLVFSLYDRDGNAQDGFLRLNQIYNLNLASDLVVLSACQTALGKDVRGEGLIGLTRGFMYAGARRVVASLWKVDDAATAEFMKRFYQNLLQKNLAPASALREAQNEMKQIARFRHPYFWAGFTLQGDWK